MNETDENTYTKNNVTLQEYEIHKYVYELGLVNVPRIYDYNAETMVLKMYNIKQLSVSDYYGEESFHTPDEVYDKIRVIVQKLYDNNVEYPDITGYNFIEENDKIWIIDFGHASFIPLQNLNSRKVQKISEPFIKKFLNGYNGWNPEFR